AGQSRAHWLALFDGSDACVGPVLSPDDAKADPHMAARGVWQTTDGRLQAAAAPRFDGKKPAPAPPSPYRGQHTAEILAELKGDASNR
ncbi:MAG: CoA transferase, partial [Nisaea sp.]